MQGEALKGLSALMASAQRGRKPLTLTWAADERPATPLDFVEGLLCDAQFSILYGDTNTGKTFLALDLALHVALGWPWFGRAVEQGTAVYVAAEGGAGIFNRVVAFRQRYGLSEPPPLALISEGVDLKGGFDAERLVAAVGEAEAASAGRVRLLVVDTLSRALAGGNENSSDDMGALVANVDRIRRETGAHVLFVHHTGKEAKRGARGHSLLTAAVDTAIEITRLKARGLVKAEIVKQRDLELAPSFTFSLDSVRIPSGSPGRPLSSCVIVPASEAEPSGAQGPTRQQSRALSFLDRMAASEGVEPPAGLGAPAGARAVSYERWRELCGREGLSSTGNDSTESRVFSRAVAELMRGGYIGRAGDWVWVVLQKAG